jgi:phosphate acetyltransferase
MTKNIYISGAEPRSGKSVVTLAVCDILAAATPRLGFFRPVISADDESDTLLALIAERYHLAATQRAGFGCTHKTARAMIASGKYEDLLTRILERFKTLQEHCDHIVCLGTDYSSVTSAFELGFNADIANNLNCLIIPVVDGKDRSTSTPAISSPCLSTASIPHVYWKQNRI